MQFNIKIEGLDKAMKQLDPKTVKKATSKTINDMAGAVKTQEAKEIGGKYNLSARRIKQDIKIIAKATQNNLRAILSFTGNPPGLQDYKAKRKKARRLKKGYRPGSVSVEVIKGQRKTVKGGFMIAGKIGIFRRETKRRYPLDRLSGPSIRGMFKAIDGKSKAQKILSERVSKTFWHHYNFFRSKVR